MSAARRPRRGATPNPAGAHRLADHAARALVASAGITAQALVLDIGAGTGAITRPLADTGARVIAVERDERVARWLTHRMTKHPRVTVVTGDALQIPLPHHPFQVVANLPFAITTPLLRRLLERRLVAADLVVEAGAGRRLAAGAGRREVAGWHRRYAFSLGPVLPARLFRPAPPVDAIVLRLRRHRGKGGSGLGVLCDPAQ